MDNENTMTFSIDKERYEYHYKKGVEKLYDYLLLLLFGLF